MSKPRTGSASLPMAIERPIEIERVPSTDSEAFQTPAGGSRDSSSDAGRSSNNLNLSVSRSIEVSCALRSRSPWIGSSAHSSMEESVDRAFERIRHARDRSLSLASQHASTQGDGLVDGASGHTASRHHMSHRLPGADRLRNLDDFDDSRGVNPLTDDVRGLLDLPDTENSTRSLLSRDRDGHGAYGNKEELSSFGQSLFNSCNMLMGVGLLSLPYAMRLAGWFGIFVLLLCSGAHFFNFTFRPRSTNTDS